jgi:hypothetical protein
MVIAAVNNHVLFECRCHDGMPAVAKCTWPTWVEPCQSEVRVDPFTGSQGPDLSICWSLDCW